MAEQATIPVTPGLRDRIRRLKGFERTYDEVLSAWADMAEDRESTA
ncbi:hypothetical protein [Halalkalicoccus sp. NIPERK01]|nr:hypothetical protein [Halalkalicoccus sp. NIPERK01]MDL5360398.1 hypothetical protein [Halalkalicoccus sp. NIPERK01]